MIHQAELLLNEFIQYVKDEERQNDILSIYLVVDQSDPHNQRANPAWKVFFKNALQKIDKEVVKTQKSEWEAVKARAEAYLQTYRPAGKTLALYVGPKGEIGIDLPVALENKIHYGFPQIKQFLWALDEYQEYLVVLFATDRVRSEHVFLTRSIQNTQISLNLDTNWGHREIRKSAHEANIAQRKDEFDRRFAREVANELNRLFLENQDIERMIFGGNLRQAHAVHNMLHPKVAEGVIALMNLPYDMKDFDIVTQIADVATGFERENEVTLVDEVINSANSGRRAVAGEAGVLEALDQQAVQLLVLPYPIDRNLADELFVKAIASSSDVEFVHGKAAENLAKAGGVAARLYYRI